jgi:adenylate cyclase
MAQLIYDVEGKRVQLPLDRAELTVGRSADNDIVIRDAAISRHHARIHRGGQAWRVSDLGSSNGTRINDGNAFGRDLRSGDRILLHKYAIVFMDDDATALPEGLLVDDSDAALHEGGTIIRSAASFGSLASVQSADGGGERRMARLLEVVSRASEALLTSSSLDQTLDSVLSLVFSHLKVERAAILLWDPQREDLTLHSSRQNSGKSAGMKFSRTIAEKVFQERVAILTHDAMSDDRFADGQSIIDMAIHAAMAAPLSDGEQALGLIYTDSPMSKGNFDSFDLDLLSALANHAAVAIEQARLRQSVLDQELVRRKLERYHSPAVIEHITSHGAPDGELAPAELDVTVLFADVVGFTGRAESMEPRDVAAMLNRYFSEMSEAIFHHDGMLDKFIGDCLMAVFGAPIPSEDHARRAASAACEMLQALKELDAPLEASERMQFRIGMHSGKVIAGDIGSIRRSDYTVLGSTVNLASRLESDVADPGQIVISETTRQLLGDAFDTRPLGRHQPKGIAQPVDCHEIIGVRSD